MNMKKKVKNLQYWDNIHNILITFAHITNYTKIIIFCHMKSEYCDEEYALENYKFNYYPEDSNNDYHYDYEPDSYESAQDAMNNCLEGMLNYR